MQNKPNFPDALMNVTSFYTMDYENKRLADAAKTKPIQSQYKANTNPIPEKPKMNVTSILTKDYENEIAFRPQKNKPNSNPIKPNFKPDTLLFCGAWLIAAFIGQIIAMLTTKILRASD